MSTLFDDGPEPGDNAPALTISELSGAVKRAIEGGFSHVRVRGEVGRVSRPRSGHLYLDLKDDKAVLAGIVWKGVATQLTTQPEEGMEVIATGRLTTFPGQSRYQIIIESIAPAGVGALMAMLEKRKAALTAEGLFAPERKKNIPYLPEVIGVVTSPSGAVIRDILHRLRDRFPRKVLVWPVAVQGQNCAKEVANAIHGFNQMTPGGALPRPDLLIVARGGGSLEDLWGFNEEIVVRAAADSAIPLISAVGHETDTTLIDYAADRRAPTPTAAAEMAVPVRAELLGTIASFEERRIHAMTRHVQNNRERLTSLARALPRPDTLVQERAQRLDTASMRLPQALSGFVARKEIELRRRGAERLSPTILRDRIARRADQVASLHPDTALTRRIERGHDHLARLRLSTASLTRGVRDGGRLLTKIAARLPQLAPGLTQMRRENLTALNRMLETLSYHETLNRGFAVVRSGGEVVTNGDIRPGAALDIEFQGGKHIIAVAGGTGKSMPKRKPTPRKPDQGNLF